MTETFPMRFYYGEVPYNPLKRTKENLVTQCDSLSVFWAVRGAPKVTYGQSSVPKQ